jgi:hypothetical protein
MAAKTSLFSRYLSALKRIEHQHAGPKGNILTSTDRLLAFKNKIRVWRKHLPSGNIDQYFPSLSSEMCDWVRNPFVGFSQNSVSVEEAQQLNKLQCDRSLKMKFN